MPPIPKQPEDSLTVQCIYEAYQAKNDAEASRGYLGASIIGGPCDRALWYGFRHCGEESFSGRMLALFDTGHRSEFQFVDELRMIGCTVHDNDEDGNQFEVKALAGHFSGHMDGCALGVPEAPKTWHVLEFKTHSKKSFADMKRKGVAEAKPQHYAQMQVYMKLTGMKRALYLAKDKDTDERYAERIRYSSAEANALLDRAERIIKAQSAPPRISDNRDFCQCRFCSHRDRCHGGEDAAASPAVACTISCRNCVHSTPEMDADYGRWSCAKHGKTISRAEQDRACADHLFLPSLINFAEPIDAGKDDDGHDWIEYSNEDGTTWRTGRSGHVYKSKELTELPGPLVGAGVVDDVKSVFTEATIEGVRRD